MTLEFEGALLKYLFQDKAAGKYKEYLDMSVFEVPTFRLVYDLWYKYVTKYKNIPPKANFLEYVDRAVKHAKGAVTHEVYSEMLNVIAVAYSPEAQEYEFTRDMIVEFARKKETKNLFISKADKLKNATVEELDEIYNQMRRIVNIGAETTEEDKNRGGFLFRDGDKHSNDVMIEGHPTYLHGVNKVTAARGFYSPQLILLMGGPKAFKTGTILSILIEYARMGKKVFIADAENGLDDIRSRIKQGLLECERHEVGTYRTELKSIFKKLRMFGGDIVTNFYPAYISTLDHVDAELERLAVEEEWIPDIIFYDYLQLFGSSNKKIFDRQKQIQDVYHHAIRLNNKWGTFAFTAIKVKQGAVNKLVLKPSDIGEDFAQAYNCHATFALCRTEDEEREGNGRIVPVLQRAGTAYKYGASTTCCVKIEAEKQTITELDADAYMAILEEEYSKKPASTRKKYIPPSSLRDE